MGVVAERHARGRYGAPRCQPRQHAIGGFINPIRPLPQNWRDDRPFLVEQAGILGGRRKHPASLEPNDEEMGPPRVTGL